MGSGRWLTVGEIAERLAPIAPDVEGTIQRIRHWTREGLLSPQGSRNPGTGRHRVYDDSVILDCAVLNFLADQGFSVGKQRQLMVATVLIQQAKELWAEKGRSRKMLYLEIANFGDPNPQGGTEAVFLHEGRGDLIHPRADSSLVLNLSRIFARLEKQK